MLIEYSSVFNPQNALEIKDLSRCAIEGVNDDGLYFYYVIIAVRGIATIATCGPVIPELTELPPGYTCELTMMKYNQKKIFSNIFKWLNGKKPGKSKSISSAKIICIEDALAEFRNISDYFYNNLDLSTRIFDAMEEEPNE